MGGGLRAAGWLSGDPHGAPHREDGRTQSPNPGPGGGRGGCRGRGRVGLEPQVCRGARPRPQLPTPTPRTASPPGWCSRRPWAPAKSPARPHPSRPPSLRVLVPPDHHLSRPPSPSVPVSLHPHPPRSPSPSALCRIRRGCSPDPLGAQRPRSLGAQSRRRPPRPRVPRAPPSAPCTPVPAGSACCSRHRVGPGSGDSACARGPSCLAGGAKTHCGSRAPSR